MTEFIEVTSARILLAINFLLAAIIFIIGGWYLGTGIVYLAIFILKPFI